MVATLFQRVSFIGRLRFLLLDRHQTLTTRVALIVVCLALTPVTAFLLREFNPNDPFLILRQFAPVILIGLITVAALIYRAMHVPVLITLMLTTVLHDGISTGTDTKISFTFFMLYVWLFVWLFKTLVIERKFALKPSYTNVGAGLFITVVLLSFLWSNAFVEERVGFLYADKTIPRLMTALVIIISMATHVLFANNVNSERTLKQFVWWFIGVGVVFAVIRFTAGTVPYPFNDRGQFPAWAVAFMLGQLFFNNALRWQVRLVLVVGILIWMQQTLGLGIGWLSGWVPLGIVAMGLIFFRSRQMFVFALLLIGIYGVTQIGNIQQTLAAEEAESGNTRALSWQRTFGVTGDHLFLGTGPAGYHFYFTAYGYYNMGPTGTFNLSHNNYVDILAQTGLVGFSVWIIFWVAQGFNTLRLLLTPAPNGFFKGVKYTLIACYPAILITMMLGDWITPFPYTQTLAGIDYTIWAWMLTGLTVAVYHLMREQNAALPLQTVTAN